MPRRRTHTFTAEQLAGALFLHAPHGTRYVGGPGFISGIPTRDLSAEEWAALPAPLRQIGLATRLYIPIEETHDHADS